MGLEGTTFMDPTHYTQQWQKWLPPPTKGFLSSSLECLTLLFVILKDWLTVSRKRQLFAFLLHKAREYIANGEIQEAGDLP